MKQSLWLAVLACGVGVSAAQESPVPEWTEKTEGLEEARPWLFRGGLIYKNMLYEHNALQTRAPDSSPPGRDWEEGDTDGSGWGLLANIGRGDGHLTLSFVKSDFDYDLVVVGGSHHIETVSRDFELSWSQVRGRTPQSSWGSTLGFRYLGTQHDVTITEGSTSVTGSGDVTWLMILGGYDGSWYPFATRTFEAHGSVRFLLGEADGIARRGKDDDWTDGVLSETYDNEYSLGYGANASFGINVAVTKRLQVTIDYRREWLYSFDATDTGIVVFPDNADALFIENHHALTASLDYRF